MQQQFPEHKLFTDIELCIKLAAQLTAIGFDSKHVNVVTGRQGFPDSPEKYGPNIRTDNYVLMSDTFQECLQHLMAARKSLLLLGVQFAPEQLDHEKSLPSETTDLRQ
jgi:hypothetical protein